jgi:hypothetical protein
MCGSVEICLVKTIFYIVNLCWSPENVHYWLVTEVLIVIQKTGLLIL